MLEKIFHDVQAIIYFLYVFQWKQNPATKQASTDRCNCPVYDIQQTFALVRKTVYQFKVADCEAVQSDIPVFLNFADACYVGNLIVLCDIQIVQNSTGSHNGVRHFYNAKTFKRPCFKLLEQPFLRSIFSENPVVQFVGKVVGCESEVKFAFGTANHEHFLWSKVCH